MFESFPGARRALVRLLSIPLIGLGMQLAVPLPRRQRRHRRRPRPLLMSPSWRTNALAQMAAGTLITHALTQAYPIASRPSMTPGRRSMR
jgi:hypothetical protein